MKLFLLSLIVFQSFFQEQCFGQSVRPESKFEYYVFLEGVDSKGDIEEIETTIVRKSNVKYFMADNFPPKYFLLLSDEIITPSTLKDWLPSVRFTIAYFGEGVSGKEGAINTAKQRKKSN